MFGDEKNGRSKAPGDAPQGALQGNGVGSTWQERAIERRLGDARARAVARSTRFMTTALELVQESGHANFTLQTLADRANLSLRTFYQHFAGKDELLLALYEDVTAQFTEAIREKVEAADGPMAQLEAWCKGVLSRPGSSQEVGGRLVLIYQLEPRDGSSGGVRQSMGTTPQAVDRDSDRVFASGPNSKRSHPAAIDVIVGLHNDVSWASSTRCTRGWTAPA